MNFSGADWIERALKLSMSPLGKDAADILGAVYRGIYHIDQSRNNRALERVDWSDPYCITVKLPSGYSLSTWDGSELTGLVILAHDKAVRVELNARFNGQVELRFHRRLREGSVSERHPSIERAVEALRKAYGVLPPELQESSIAKAAERMRLHPPSESVLNALRVAAQVNE